MKIHKSSSFPRCHVPRNYETIQQFRMSSRGDVARIHHLTSFFINIQISEKHEYRLVIHKCQATTAAFPSHLNLQLTTVQNPAKSP